MTYKEFVDSGYDTSGFTKKKNFWGKNFIYLDANTRIAQGQHLVDSTKTHYLFKDAIFLQRWTWFFWHTKVVLYKEFCAGDPLNIIVASLLKTDSGDSDFLHSKI